MLKRQSVKIEIVAGGQTQHLRIYGLTDDEEETFYEKLEQIFGEDSLSSRVDDPRQTSYLELWVRGEDIAVVEKQTMTILKGMQILL